MNENLQDWPELRFAHTKPSFSHKHVALGKWAHNEMFPSPHYPPAQIEIPSTAEDTKGFFSYHF